MAQSLANILLHVVFSTKNRAPYLDPPAVREGMSGYLVGTLRNIGCPSLATHCVADHVHVLCQLSRTLTVAKLVEEIKTSSSKWIKQEHPRLTEFHWQAGYGAFSVSQSNAEQVRQYIANQESHHRQRTFQDEFRELLRRHELEWDERSVWD